MNEVYHDVEIEPKLQPLRDKSFVNNSTTIEDEARIDIRANGSGVRRLPALSLT